MSILKIELNTDDFIVRKEKGLEMTPEAQEAILKVIAIKERAEEALEAIKQSIIEKGREISSEFKGLVGDDVKGYIKKGEKYSAEDKTKVPEWALKEIKFKKLDQAEVAQYEKEKGELPTGVTKKDDVTSFVLLYDKERVKDVALLIFPVKRISEKS